MNWEKTLLGKIAISYSGGTPRRDKPEYFGGSIPWVSSSEVNLPYIDDTKEKITELGFITSSAKWIPKNSVLIALYGATAGQVSKLLIDATANQAVLAIIPNIEKLNVDFLYYQLKHNKNKLLYQAQGSGQPNLSKDLIDKLEIEIPPKLKEQTRIAEILSAADEAIADTERLIAKYTRIKTGLMQDLLTRGIDEHGNIRSKSTHKFVVKNGIEVPEEWEVNTLGNNANIHNNLRKPISSLERFEKKGIYPYFGATGIIDYINEFGVEGKFVLIGEDGDHYLKFEKQEMTHLVEGRFNVSNHAHILSGKGDCSTEWIHHFFCHRDITLYLTRQGAGRFKLNKQTLINLPICVPPSSEQNKIIELMNAFNHCFLTKQQQLTKLHSLKTGLMQDLLSGKKRVKALDEV